MSQNTGMAAEFAASWRVVLVALLGTIVGIYGVSFYSFGVFVGPLSHSQGWSLSSVTAWVMFWSLGQIVTLPLIGRFADRFGARATVLISVPLFAAALAGVALVGTQIWAFYALALLVGCLGTGVSLMTYGRIINGWFHAGRGTALGIIAAGTGVSAIFAPRMMQAVVDKFGWRFGFVMLGVIALLIWPLVAAWLIERREVAEPGDMRPVPGLTVDEALRTLAFWLIAAGLLLSNAALGANIMLIPFLSSGGLSRADASMFAGLLGLFTMAGNLALGHTIDRGVPVSRLLAGALAVQALGFALLGATGVRYAVLAIPVIGFCIGGATASGGYAIARYFGLKSYGQLFGLLGIAIGVGIGLGPVAFSWLHDLTGQYGPPFGLFAGMLMLAAVFFLLLGRCPPADQRSPAAIVPEALPAE